MLKKGGPLIGQLNRNGDQLISVNLTWRGKFYCVRIMKKMSPMPHGLLKAQSCRAPTTSSQYVIRESQKHADYPESPPAAIFLVVIM